MFEKLPSEKPESEQRASSVVATKICFFAGFFRAKVPARQEQTPVEKQCAQDADLPSCLLDALQAGFPESRYVVKEPVCVFEKIRSAGISGKPQMP